MKPTIDYNEQLLTPKQLSEWLQIKLSTIYKWSHSGYIPCIKLGGQDKGSLRFSRGDIVPWLKRRTKRGRSTYRLEADVLTNGILSWDQSGTCERENNRKIGTIHENI